MEILGYALFVVAICFAIGAVYNFIRGNDDSSHSASESLCYPT